MKKFLSIAALSVALSACQTATWGNHVKDAVDQEKLAADAIKKMAVLWPPAKTKLEMQQPTPDVFGNDLVKGLRERGYAVLEYHPDTAKAKAAEAANAAPATSATAALPLRYMLDSNANFYRLSITVGNQTITRPYTQQDGALVPSGYWVRKEQ